MEILNIFANIDWITWVITIFSMTYIALAIRNKPMAFLFGLIASVLWFIADITLYNLKFDAVLQLFYAGMSIWGIYSWKYGSEHKTELPIARLSINQHVILFITGLVISVLAGWFASQYFDTNLPYLDSFTTGFSIIATFLLVKRYIDNWIYWIVINPIYIYIYWVSGAQLLVVIMLVYTILAVTGYLNWRKLMLGARFEADI